jgi:hypothetical protein
VYTMERTTHLHCVGIQRGVLMTGQGLDAAGDRSPRRDTLDGGQCYHGNRAPSDILQVMSRGDRGGVDHRGGSSHHPRDLIGGQTRRARRSLVLEKELDIVKLGETRATNMDVHHVRGRRS